jgi:hypothetical protein
MNNPNKAKPFERRGRKQISMTTGRLKHIHLVLILGISLFIPLLQGYFIYVDLSGIVPLFSDMSFENPDYNNLSTCQNKFKGFVPVVSSNPLLPWTHFGRGASLFSSPLTSDSQIPPVLRC